MVFSNEEDFDICKSFLAEVCFIAYPPLDDDYRFIENLGSGSQASVDHYKLAINRNPNTPPSSGIPSPLI